jgi:hypothetical protein
LHRADPTAAAFYHRPVPRSEPHALWLVSCQATVAALAPALSGGSAVARHVERRPRGVTPIGADVPRTGAFVQHLAGGDSGIA